MRKEWRGFKGTKWTDEVNMRHSSPVQQKQPTFCGDACRSCRRKSVLRVACSTWRQRLFQV